MLASPWARRAPGFRFRCASCTWPPSASWLTGFVVSPTTKGPCTSEATSRKDPERPSTEAVWLKDTQVDCEVRAGEAPSRD